MTPVLLHLPYSPWSERARWALDARGIAYDKQTYQPLLGEPVLRWKLRRLRGTVSVPVLFTDDGPISESHDIARWADARGTGPILFPAGSDGAIDHWVARSQDAMAAGRALSLSRVLAHDTAIDELTPKSARVLGPVARAITRSGVKRTRRKYGGNATRDEDHAATLSSVLDELRGAVGRGATILDAFSYADITAAQVLCFVEPHDGNYLRLGAANRESFGDPDLAKRYPELLRWRDALYARHR